MYTAYIGRRIVELHNEHVHDGTPQTPKEFFDDVLFPVFFDNERYLFWPNNSPFAQPKYAGNRDQPDTRLEALAETHEKISAIQRPVGHLYIGGMADGATETTSGQVSTVGVLANPDEAYCSWIGAMAGIGVAGGLSLLIDHDVVLRALVEGWVLYRTYLDQTPSLKGNQVETWNGRWITHRFGPDYAIDDPLRDFSPPGTRKISTQDWSHVLFALAQRLPREWLTVYVYSLGNTNTTIGFRQLHLPEINRLSELYTHLFGEVEGLPPHRLADVYETEYSLYRACEQGAIGLKALRPRRLNEYIPGGRSSKMPTPTRSESKRIRFLIYQTWIIAMLNNQDLIETTEKTAKALIEHATSDKKARSTARRRAEQVLEASHRRAFLEALTEVIENDGSHADYFNRLADEVVKMPSSDFPLFVTLLRLKYAFLNK